jgi:DNA-binding IclR family transcriptional regulator
MCIDLHSSGAGKAILADLPADRLDAYLETSSLSRHTPATITDVDDLRTELAAGRESELTYDYGERFEDVNCVATPLDVDAPVPAALSLALPSDEYDRSTLESTVADEVHNIGRVIEMKRKYDDLE